MRLIHETEQEEPIMATATTITPAVTTTTLEFWNVRRLEDSGEFSYWDSCPQHVTDEESASIWYGDLPGYQLAKSSEIITEIATIDENGLTNMKSTIYVERQELAPVFNTRK
jgi:hypothetical protein